MAGFNKDDTVSTDRECCTSSTIGGDRYGDHSIQSFTGIIRLRFIPGRLYDGRGLRLMAPRG